MVDLTGKGYEDYTYSEDGQLKRGKYVLVTSQPDLWPIAVDADGEVTRLNTIHGATVYDTFEQADDAAHNLSESRSLGDRLYVLPFVAVLDHEYGIAVLKDFKEGRR